MCNWAKSKSSMNNMKIINRSIIHNNIRQKIIFERFSFSLNMPSKDYIILNLQNRNFVTLAHLAIP